MHRRLISFLLTAKRATYASQGDDASVPSGVRQPKAKLGATLEKSGFSKVKFNLNELDKRGCFGD